MAKQPLSLKVRLSRYESPRNEWIPFRDAWEGAKKNNYLNDSYQMIVRYTKSQLKKSSRQSRATD